MYRPLRLLVGIALLCLTASTMSAAFVIYTNKPTWDAAVGALGGMVKSETFDDALLEPWLTITSDGGGHVNLFKWDSIVDSNPVKNDTFFLGPLVQPSRGWIAAFNLGEPGGAGEGINVYADLGGVETFLGNIDRTYIGTWGFLADQAFSYVRLTGGGNPLGIQETYWLDDLSVAYIPEPGTYALVGAGLLLLALRRRK